MQQPALDRPAVVLVAVVTACGITLLAIFGIVLGAVALATRSAPAPSGANPWTFTMTDPGAGGLQVKGVAGSSTNLEEWLDHNDVPIAAVGQVGGFKVFGDDIGVNPPGNVHQSSVVLHDTGGVTLAIHGPTLYGGAAAPAMACKTGDFYFRQSLVPGQRVYECDAGRWVPIL